MTSPAVLEAVVDRLGLDASDLPARIAAAETKAELRRLTEEAVALGIFGVPSFLLGNELFWGHDRMEWALRHGFVRSAA